MWQLGYKQKKKRTASSYGESQFQRNVIQCLRLNRIYCFSVPNGIHSSVLQAKIAKAEGVLHGVSDIIILLPGGKTIFVEVKNPNGKGRQSPAQKEFEQTVTKLGFEYKIWDKWEQVQEFVKEVQR